MRGRLDQAGGRRGAGCAHRHGPVGVGPVRAVEAESLLLGREGGDALWTQAGELALKNANPRDSLVRGSRKYRLEVLPVLVQEALSMAWEDAGRKEEAHG